MKIGVFKTILLISLFLALLSFRAYAEPIWSNPTNTTPTNYNSLTNSLFNISWSNASTVFINITNSTDVLINAMMNNSTYGGDIYNYSVILPAGTWNWISYANDSLNNWNSTDNFTITIGQADNPVHLYLNGTESNKTYTYPESINATATSTGGTVYLYRDGSHIINGTSPQSELILLGNNTYVYKVNATGNQNYSGNSTDLTYYAFVNKGNPILNIYIDGLANSKTIILPSVYNVSANETAIGDSDFNYTLWRNDTQLINGSSVWNYTLLDRGIYKFFYNTTGGANWTNGTTNILYLYITDLNFSENSTNIPSPQNYSTPATYNFSIRLTGNISRVVFESNILNITNYNNYTTNSSTTYKGVVVNNSGNTYWITFPALPVYSYQYRWIANDTNNIYVSSGWFTYVIDAPTIYPSLTSSGSSPPWTTATSSSTTLSCTHTLQASLTLTGGVSSWVCSVSGGNSVSCTFTTGSTSGSSIYTCSVSGNYTGSVSGTLTWAPFQSNQNTGTTTTTTQNTTGSFTITPSSSSVTMEPGASKVITFTLRNTFSYDIININMSVSGIESSWYTLDKTLITRLQHDIGTNTTQLTLNIPSNAERKNYSIVFSASGKDFNLNKITRQTTVTLRIPQQPSQNVTNITNQTTANQTTGNQTTNVTVGEGEISKTTSVTGLSINPEDLKEIVLFIGLVAMGLTITFRTNITDFLMRGYKPKEHISKAHVEERKEEVKKESKSSSIRNKLSKYKLVIQFKEKEKT